MIAILFCQ